MILLLPPPRTIDLVVRRDGDRIGTGTYTQTVSEKGKTVRFRLDIRMPDGPIRFESENRFDASGAPTRKWLETSTPDGPVTRRVEATFGKERVTVLLDDGKAASRREIANPAVATIANAAENWFLRVRPTLGDKAVALVFSFDRLDWQGNESTYLGEVEWRGKTRHRIQTRQADRFVTSYLDDDGMPVRVDDPSGWLLEEKE